MGRENSGRKTEIGNDNGAERYSKHSKTTLIVVDRAKLVTIKGEMRRETAELVILDGYVSFFTTFKHCLEQRSSEIENAIAKWRRQRTSAVETSKRSVL